MNQNYFYRPYQPKTLIELPCAVCGGEHFSLVREENNLNIVRCDNCEYVLVNPRPSMGDLEDFYREYYPEQEGLPESWGGEMRDIFVDAARRIHEQKPGGAILDVGSSYGHFLSQFEAPQWRATGIDPSPNAVKFCQQNYPAITAHAANFEDVELPVGSFDVITSFYVLEHVFDPRACMQRICDLLVPGGIVIIRIPYTRPFFPFARLLRRPLMYAPMHLNDFAPRHFEQMCLGLGFREVNSSVGALRVSSDFVERVGASVFGGLGRAWEKLSPSGSLFPFAGAYSYELRK